MPVYLSSARTPPGPSTGGRYYVIETKTNDSPESRSGSTRTLAEEESLEEAVIRRAERSDTAITTAESCTGGGLGSALTLVPGSSRVYGGGVVSYSYELKERLLGVSRQILERHGAVSGECALAMAKGAEERVGGNRQIAITGIAGPGGGSAEKPVGLVYMAVIDRSVASLVRFRFDGDRKEVRERSVEAALILLLEPDLPEELLGIIDGTRLTAG